MAKYSRMTRPVAAMLVAAVIGLSSLGAVPATAAELSMATMARFAEIVYRIKDGKDPDKLTPKGFTLRGVFKDSSGVYANLFEEAGSGRIVLSFAGTNFTDPGDLLADLGIAGQEIEKALDYLIEEIVDDGDVSKEVRNAAKEAMRKVMGIKKNYKKSKGRDVLGKGAKPNKKLDRQVAAALAIVDGLTKLKKANGKAIALAEVEVVGHSLGGFLTQVVAVKRQIHRAVAFNPPGADTYLNGAKAPAYLTNHSRKGDLVGRFGMHTGPLYVYKNANFHWKRVKRAYLAQNHGIKDFREDLGKGMKPKRLAEN